MYFVYVLKCSDGSFYTGITNDLDKRMLVHKNGNGSKYVRSRLPFSLIYKELVQDKSSALKRELEIKSWSREEKKKNLNIC